MNIQLKDLTEEWKDFGTAEVNLAYVHVKKRGDGSVYLVVGANPKHECAAAFSVKGLQVLAAGLLDLANELEEGLE